MDLENGVVSGRRTGPPTASVAHTASSRPSVVRTKQHSADMQPGRLPGAPGRNDRDQGEESGGIQQTVRKDARQDKVKCKSAPSPVRTDGKDYASFRAPSSVRTDAKEYASTSCV